MAIATPHVTNQMCGMRSADASQENGELPPEQMQPEPSFGLTSLPDHVLSHRLWHRHRLPLRHRNLRDCRLLCAVCKEGEEPGNASQKMLIWCFIDFIHTEQRMSQIN